MKNALLFFGIILPHFVASQCTFSDFFTLKIGISKFEATKFLKLDKKVYGIKDNLEFWSSNEQGTDSVLITFMEYHIRDTKCLPNKNVKYSLGFIDRKLTSIDLNIEFGADGLDSCLSKLEEITKFLKMDFPIQSEHTTSNDAAGQIGEGKWFYRSEESKKQKKEKISLGYEIDYEYDFRGGKTKNTGRVRGYTLEIKYLNFEGTKLNYSED